MINYLLIGFACACGRAFLQHKGKEITMSISILQENIRYYKKMAHYYKKIIFLGEKKKSYQVKTFYFTRKKKLFFLRTNILLREKESFFCT